MENSAFGRELDAHFDRKYADLCDALEDQGCMEDCEPDEFDYDEDWH